MPATQEISGQTAMQDILDAYPSARRALFQRYHIGGCSSCGYSPTDTLEQVLSNHNVMDIEDTIAYLKESQQVDDKLKITPAELKALLDSGSQNPPKLIDVRDQWEFDIAHIEGAQLMTRPLIGEMMETWPKDSLLVFSCHHGTRSLDAASYFIGHGFTNVRSLEGGIDRWAAEIDPTLNRY